MKDGEIIILLGSPLRAGVLGHLSSRGVALRAVLVPGSPRHEATGRAARDQGHPPIPVARDGVPGTLRELGAQIIVCVGWPFLFGPEVVEGPWLLLNSHPTLLPEYRGPNPWYHVIADGKRSAGVTIHRIDRGVDSGPILHQRSVALTPFDTYRSLKSKMVALEPVAIEEALSKLRSGAAEFSPQDEGRASTFLHKRTPEDSRLDPNRPLIELVDHIRACDPDGFPAFFEYMGQRVYIRLSRKSRGGDESPESL